MLEKSTSNHPTIQPSNALTIGQLKTLKIQLRSSFSSFFFSNLIPLNSPNERIVIVIERFYSQILDLISHRTHVPNKIKVANTYITYIYIYIWQFYFFKKKKAINFVLKTTWVLTC